MSAAPAHTFTTWDDPAWATDRLVDEGAIQHVHFVGEVTPIDEPYKIKVELVQRDHLDLEVTPALFSRKAAQISVDGTRMTAEAARELAKLLISAADTLQSADS